MQLGRDFVVINMPMLFRTFAKKVAIGNVIMSVVEVEGFNVLLNGGKNVAMTLEGD
jgi:hypothetical protein